MKLIYVTRMFFVTIAVLTVTTTVSAVSLEDIDIETVASESGRRIPRGVAGVLSKLLFGGTNTFVTLQLGEVPPDHPLVKYPNPIQMTARKTNEKLLIALPLDKDTPSPTKSSYSQQRRKDRNNGAEKSDLDSAASSNPGEDDDTPLSPMESAANTLSYSVLQDKYEPFIHKPPSVPKKRDPMKPASLHLPGLQYTESSDGTVSVLPATPYTKILGEEALKATRTQIPDLSQPPTVPIPQAVVDLMASVAASTTIEPHVTSGKTKRIPAVVQTKTLRSDGTSSVTYTPIYISDGPFEWWRTQGLPPAPRQKSKRGPPRRKIPRHHHRRPPQTFKIHPHNMQPNQIHMNPSSPPGAFTKQMYMTQ